MRTSISVLITLASMLALVPQAQAAVRLRNAACPVQANASFKIVGARNEWEGVGSEYQWLASERPGWERTDQAHISVDGKDYDLLRISKGGYRQTICFDITDFYGKT